jgi:antitoxin MazE
MNWPLFESNAKTDLDTYLHSGYDSAMKTTLIPIGNSRGVRIPKPFIEQCGLTNQVEMDVQDRMILIHAPRQPRADWAHAFAEMAFAGDDALLDGHPPPTRWNKEDWQWK